MYYWNPCNPFSYPTGQTSSACGNVAVCMRPPGASQDVINSLGKHISATFTQDHGGVHLSYASTKFAANVILRCNQCLQNSFLDAETYPPYITNATSVFSFILNSKYACSSLPSSPKTSTRLTGGSTGTPLHSTNAPSSRNAATTFKTLSFVLFCFALFSLMSVLD